MTHYLLFHMLIITGTIIEAASSGVEGFAAGAVFYQVSTHPSWYHPIV